MKKLYWVLSILFLTSCSSVQFVNDADEVNVKMEDSKIESGGLEEVQLIGSKEREIEKEEKYKVIAETLNLRSGPGQEFEKIGSLRKNHEVKILETNGDWVKVDAGGNQIGYISKEYLAPVDDHFMSRDDKDDLINSEEPPAEREENAENNNYTVEADLLNVRAYANENSEVKDQISRGTKVEIILDTDLTGNEWVKISYQSKEGYVKKEFLKGE